MIYKERETWLEAILNTLPDHVFILDESGRYIESFGGTHHSKRSTQNATLAYSLAMSFPQAKQMNSWGSFLTLCKITKRKS